MDVDAAGNQTLEGKRPYRDLSTLSVLALYLLVAVILTWPLALHLHDRVPMGTNDIWQNYWNFWWWKTALWERHQSPYTTDLIYAASFSGTGVPLGCHTHSPGNIIWTLPVNILLGVASALNLAVLASFGLAGFGAYLLAREYVPGRWAPFLAGLAFAYFPQHVEQSLEHLNLASIHGMPFFLWALARLARVGGRRWWILTGVFFAINCLFSWHNGLLVIPLGIGVVIFECVTGPRRAGGILLDLMKAGALAALLVAPFLWPLIRDAGETVSGIRKAPRDKPIDPLFFLIPHSGHPIWGAALARIHEKFRYYPSVGFLGYLGLVSLALALISPAAARRQLSPGVPRHGVWLWLALAAFHLLLCLGRELVVAGQPTGIPMPFAVLDRIPIFGIVRIANRFLVPAALAVAVLAGVGAAAVSSLLPARGRRPFLACITVLMLLDYLWIPFPLREISRPDWLPLLADLPRGRPVLDIPSGHTARGSRDMMLQTLHGRPIVSGYTATRLQAVEETVERFPVLRRIFERHPGEEAFTGPTLTDAIRSLGVGIVVVHLDRTVDRILEEKSRARERHPGNYYAARMHHPDTGIPAGSLNIFRDELRQSFGEPIRDEAGEVEIYVVPR